MLNKFKKLFFLLMNLKKKEEDYIKYQSDMFKKYNLNRQIGDEIFEKIKKHNKFLEF